MKNLSFIFILLFTFSSLLAQKKSKQATVNPYARIDNVVEAQNSNLPTIKAVADLINNSFTTEYEKTRAIFYWVASNIRYSPDLMYSFSNNENRARLAKDVFENKAAVCLGYAVLVDSLTKLTGLTSQIILGSTRQSFLPSVFGHAWNAVKINGEWQLVDATWGSGYLRGNQFVKELNNYYFFPDQEKLIESHLPLDPIWQLKKRPVTLYQFHSHLKSTAPQDWNYNDSIDNYLRSDELTKIKANSRRLIEFGNNSEVTSNYSLFLKNKELEYYSKILSQANKNYNKGVELYNLYIDFKNHQFTPTKTDPVLQRCCRQYFHNWTVRRQNMVWYSVR